MLKLDIERLIGKSPDFFVIVKLIFTNMGVLATALMRIQTWLYNRGHNRIASFIRNLNIILTGADFCIGCKIGKGLIVRHPNGIVIGSGSIIGDSCTLLQQVTLGERNGDGSDSTHAYPLVMNNVVINAGAKVVGGVVLGNNVIVGANAVVLNDVPENCVAIGIPAKIIHKK